MNKLCKIKNACKSTARLAVLIILGAVLGINVYLANANSLVGDQLPMPFGYGVAVVLSGSMEPELSVDDLIIVKKAESYAKNDVVVFQSEGTLVVHRVIETDGDVLTTKGDANTTADEPVSVSTVKGRVVFCIPFAGKLINILKTPIGTISTIAAAIALVEIPRRREKQKDDEEREKILAEIERLKNDQ